MCKAMMVYTTVSCKLPFVSGNSHSLSSQLFSTFHPILLLVRNRGRLFALCIGSMFVAKKKNTSRLKFLHKQELSLCARTYSHMLWDLLSG